MTQISILPTSRFLMCLVMACLLNGQVLTTLAIADEEKPIEAAAVDLGRPVEFERDVYPILEANCVACHNLAKSESDLVLESAAAIMKGGASGPAVVPGKPEESLLYLSAARIEDPVMPPWPNESKALKLTPNQVGLLKQWIVEGAHAGAAASAANMNWQPINSQLKAIYAVATDSYGRFAAAGRGGAVTVYDLASTSHERLLVDPNLNSDGTVSAIAHRDYVHSMAFHPGGNLIATSGFQVVKLWHRDMEKAVQDVAGLSPVKLCSVSADGTIAAILQQDGAIQTYDVKAGKTLHSLPATEPASDAATVSAVRVIGPENGWIAMGDSAGVVSIVAAADAKPIAVADSLNVKIVDVASLPVGERLLALGEDGSLHSLTIDTANAKLVAGDRIVSEAGPIRQVALAGAIVMTRCEGTVVEIRKNDTLQVAATVKSAAPLEFASLSEDGQRVVTVANGGVAQLWNATDGKAVATLDQDLAAVRTQIASDADKAMRDARVAVVKSQVDADEKHLKEQQDSLTKAEEEVKTATTALDEATKKHAEAVTKSAAAKTALDAKADDAALKKALEDAQKAEQTAKDAVTTAENELKSANKGTELSKQAIERATKRRDERKELLASVEAEQAASATAAENAKAAATAKVSAKYAGFVSGGTLVVVMDTTGSVRLWKTADGAALDVLSCGLPADEIVNCMSHGDQLWAQTKDGGLKTVNVFPAWRLQRVLGPGEENAPSVFTDRVLALAFSPDGSILAAAGGEASRSGQVTLWDVASGTLIREIQDAHSDTVYGVDFSADGKLLATAAADKFVKVFDVSTGEHVRSYEGHTHHVMDVSWKGDRATLASAGADNAIKIWNAETGEQARTITTYSKQVTSLEFVGLQDNFVSCSGDKRVFLHTAGNGKAVREFKGCPDYVYSLAATDDGSVVVAGCEDGVLRVWNGNDAKEITSFAPKTN